MSKTISLNQVRVATPCPAAWKDMQGNERVRFCEQCQLNVYNISSMSKTDAEALIADTEGRLCVTYFQRADGTIITQDCPLGVRVARAVTRRVVGLAAAICGVLFALTTWAENPSGVARTRSIRHVEPFRRLIAWLDRQPIQNPPIRIMGVIAPPNVGRPRRGGP